MAFNIDVEVGAIKKNRAMVHVFCSSLTAQWDFKVEAAKIPQFIKDLRTDKSINVQKSRLPTPPNSSIISELELCLCSLGSTPEILKTTKFQEFLKIPDDIRRSLKYVSKTREMQIQNSAFFVKHSRNVKKNGEKRFFAITSTGTTGAKNLCYYRKQGDKHPISMLKLAKSVKFVPLPEIPNAFLIASGKRNWIMQAEKQRDFKVWKLLLNKTISGKDVDEQQLSKKVDRKNSVFGKMNQGLKKLSIHKTSKKEERKQKVDIEKLKLDNRNLKKELIELNNKIQEAAQLLGEKESEKETTQKQESGERDKYMQRFELKKVEMEDIHTKELEVIRKKIEDVMRKIEEKARRNGTSGVDDVFDDLEDDDEDENKDNQMQQDEEDLDLGGMSKTDRRIMEKMPVMSENTINGKTQDYTATYKNLHRHHFEHIMRHIHTHVHDDTNPEAKEEICYTHTRTLAHTIVHTSTEFSVKTRLFGGGGV